MAEYKYFEELKTSLEEAIAYKRGDRRQARVSVRTVAVPPNTRPKRMLVLERKCACLSEHLGQPLACPPGRLKHGRPGETSPTVQRGTCSI